MESDNSIFKEIWTYKLEIAKLSKNFDMEKLKYSVKMISKNYLSIDNEFTNFILYNDEFKNLNQVLLKLIIDKNFDEDEFDLEYKSFLKIYLIKTNFKNSKKLIEIIFDKISYILDKKDFESKLFNRLLDLINILTNCNVFYDQNYSINFSGEKKSFLKCEFNNKKESHRYYFDKNFIFVLNFYIELLPEKEKFNLISYVNKDTNDGYSIFIEKNTLFFSVKVRENLTIIEIVSDLRNMINLKYNKFIFSCSKTKKNCSLYFKLNQKLFIFEDKKEMELFKPFINCFNQDLILFENISGKITSFFILENVDIKNILPILDEPIFSKGISNLSSYNYFLKNFENIQVKLMLSGFSNFKKKLNYIVIYDNYENKVFLGNEEDIKFCRFDPKDFDNEMLSLDIFDTIFILLNYVDNEKQLTILFKIIHNLFSKKNIVNCLFEKKKKNIFKIFLSSIICSNISSFLNYDNLEILINILTILPSKFQAEYFNNFLLSFQIIKKLIISEEIIKIYFNCLLKNFDLKPDITKLINIESFLNNYLGFLQSDSYLNNKKATYMSKLFEFFIPSNKNVKNTNINPLLYYFTFINTRREESIKNSLLVLEMFINHPTIFETFRENISNCMLNLLEKINSGELIMITLKILIKVERNTELILTFWRKKFTHLVDLEKIKKIYDIYTKDKEEIENGIHLFKFLLTLLFVENKEQNDVYNENMKFKDKAYFDLFFEISILLEEDVLQKIIQILLIYLKQKTKIFIKIFNKTNLICWLIVILFKNFKKQTKKPIYDLTNKLLILYITYNLKDFNNLDCFISTIELINYYSQVKKCEELKFVIFNDLLKELIKKEYEIKNQNNLKRFILHLFKYFYLNLTLNNEKEENILNTYANLCKYLYKTINLNNQIIMNLFPLQDKSIRSSKILNLSTSTFLSAKSKGNNFNLLKLLSIIVIDLTRYFINLKNVELEHISFSFFLSFFKKLLFYLEANRKKLKSYQINILETCIYKLLIFIFGEEKNKFLGSEIMEHLTTYKDIPNFSLNNENSNFSKKILKILKDNSEFGKCNYDHFFKNFNSKILNKKFYIETLDDRDFDKDLKEFIIEIIGNINENLSEKKLFFDINSLKRENLDRMNYITNRVAQKLNENFHLFCNEYFFDQKFFYYDLKNIYYKLNKKERNQRGNLLIKEYKDNFRNFNMFNSDDFTFKDKTDAIYKHNNISTNNFQRPFLKIKISPYWKKIHYKNFEEMYENLSFEEYSKSKNWHYFKVDYIRELYLIPSFIAIDLKKGYLRFFINFINTKKKKHIELVERKEKAHKKLQKIYKIQNIDMIIDFKFLNKRTAIQIWFNNRLMMLINFESKSDSKNFLSLLSENFPNLQNKIGKSKKIFKSNLFRKSWLKDYNISNFKYLMLINFFASRNYNDFSQYPVFPLIVKKIDTTFEPRDLSKPVGMVGNEKRIKTCKKRFDSMESFDQYPKYHYGSHYSSPAIVLHFLIRMKPYNKGCISIQDGVYDLPDRLFFSIDQLLINVMNENSDVRELIPELFYFPFILMNKNNFDFGINQNKQRVHNVGLPANFKQNPYKFVYTMRKILESQEVSEKIGDWIDLIFGYKQQGKEAIEARNIFFHLTYEENIDKLKFEDEKTKSATETQIYHFGQTPSILFKTKHSNKPYSTKNTTLVSVGAEVKYFLKKRDKKLNSKNFIYLMKEIQYVNKTTSRNNITKIIVVKDNLIELYKYNNLLGTGTKKIPFEFILLDTIKISKIKNILFLHNHDRRFKNAIEIYEKYKIIYGGFNTGEMLVFNLKTLKLISIFKIHDFKVAKLKLSIKNILLSSDVKGIINVSKINADNDNIENLYTIYDHFGYDIKDIEFCQSDQEFFIINSSKMNVEIRSLNDPSSTLFILENGFDKIYKNLNEKNNFFIKSILSLGYVSCVITYSVIRNKNYLHSFSFDGQLIGKYILDEKNDIRFRKFLVIRDECFKDNLIICNQYGDLYIFDLPFFENGRKIKSNQSSEINSMISINKMKTLLIADEKGIIDIFSLLNN